MTASTKIHDKIAKINKCLEQIEWNRKNNAECDKTAMKYKRKTLMKARWRLFKEAWAGPALNRDAAAKDLST